MLSSVAFHKSQLLSSRKKAICVIRKLLAKLSKKKFEGRPLLIRIPTLSSDPIPCYDKAGLCPLFKSL